jgi:hypothetical protein
MLAGRGRLHAVWWSSVFTNLLIHYRFRIYPFHLNVLHRASSIWITQKTIQFQLTNYTTTLSHGPVPRSTNPILYERHLHTFPSKDRKRELITHYSFMRWPSRMKDLTGLVYKISFPQDKLQG